MMHDYQLTALESAIHKLQTDIQILRQQVMVIENELRALNERVKQLERCGK
jgi:predicted  nucleic acid-binding Zn-ribbon protein